MKKPDKKQFIEQLSLGIKNRDHQLFADQLLQKMSVRTLENMDKESIQNIIKNGFEFLNKNIPNKDFGFRFYTSTEGPAWLNNKTVLELFSKDANQLLLSIENLFKNHQLRLNRKIHPVLFVNKSKQKISLTKDKQDAEPYTYIFISFSQPIHDELIEVLSDALNYHLKAVLKVEQDRPLMLAEIDTFLEKITVQKSAAHRELHDLLNWLRHSNFSFFGLKQGSLNLGICSKAFATIDPLITEKLEDRYELQKEMPFLFDAIDYISPIYRFEKIMCLSIHLEDQKQPLYLFGLLRRSSLFANNLETPIIKNKLDYIFKMHQANLHTYDYSEIVRIFSGIPKHELFRAPKTDLLEMVEHLLNITNHNHIQCYYKYLKNKKNMFLMVAVPKYLFSPKNIQIIYDYFKQILKPVKSECIEAEGAEMPRLHLYFECEKPIKDFEEESHERALGELLKSNTEKAEEILKKKYPATLANKIISQYLINIPNHYQARSAAEDIADDLVKLSQLDARQKINFSCSSFKYPESSDLYDKANLLKVYSLEKMSLIDIIPTFANLGLVVIDQLTARIANEENTLGFIQSFRVQTQNFEKIQNEATMETLAELLRLVFQKKIEDDALNTLVLEGFKIQDISCLQLYRNYFNQLDNAYLKSKINLALIQNPKSSALLVRYFRLKFDPNISQKTRSKDLLELEKEFNNSLIDVSHIESDFILRQLFDIMKATLRTNFFQDNPSALAIKIEAKEVKAMPTPVPYREIYVFSAQIEGVHFRFGPISRGGLRYSNRNSDYRKEILGLVQTQRVKNVVIVPNGAKGGFIIKNLKNPDYDTVAEHYRMFIRALLSITDNLGDNELQIPPQDCVCYDAPDPYLVVAADKGTATFSDIANDIAISEDFWLGDAFASGGQHGYDHKKYAITAKGAWECFKLHCAELGLDKQEHISCVGIGDMSGDVFGNGLLLGKHLLLKAAFNHMHIFVDPQPDAQKSWLERKRLFDLPRSTWKDYKAFGKGGAVFDRNAKEIVLSPELQALFNTQAASMSGPEMIQNILKLQVDMIWFGGIGTYIKASNESHLAVSDSANDTVRIDAAECQATIISEGANLGLTTKSRFEIAKTAASNTDAIDNSAGVNMSDYEVNIKIFMKILLASKKIKNMEDRNKMLESLADEVTELVLQNNRDQHALISQDIIRIKNHQSPFLELVESLTQSGHLSLTEEKLPTLAELKRFVKDEQLIPRPVLAVVQAYVKQENYDALLDTEFLNHPYFDPLFLNYFPKTLRDSFSKELHQHPLKKEIIALELINKVINEAGMHFIYYHADKSQQALEKILLMYLIAKDLCEADTIIKQIEEANLSKALEYEAKIAIENIISKTCLDLLLEPLLSHLSLDKIDTYKKTYQKMSNEIDKVICASPSHWLAKGFPQHIAIELAKLERVALVPEQIYLTEVLNINPNQSASILLESSQWMHFDWLEETLLNIKCSSFWEKKQKDLALSQLFQIKLSLLKSFSSFALKKSSLKKHIETQHPNVYAEFKDFQENVVFLKENPSEVQLLSINVCVNFLSKILQSMQHIF